MRPAFLPCLLLTVAGCAASPAGQAPAASTAAPAAFTAAPAVSTAPPSTDWKLVIRMSYGPCADDGRPCQGTWTATHDGTVTQDPAPRTTKPGAVTRTLAPDELARLRAIVASSDFRTSMAKGFACQGPRTDHHATWELAFTDGAGEPKKQRFEYCVSGPTDDKNVPHDLLSILKR